MKKFSAFVTLCGVAVSGLALAAEKLESGLPVGETVPAFNVRDITGPAKGETLCYRCRYGAKPVVTVFTREMNDTVTDLIKKIDAKVGANKDKKMSAFVVVLTDDPDTVEPKLEKLAKDEKIENTPLTIVEGVTGPPEYKLSKDAEVTVMMWVESEVKVNQSFAKGKLDKKAIDALVAETRKILN
ncbi:MAG: hypothetical protein EXS05_01125 [Planctomycetaceae bacterium]|nr:hypothetical protein [Planctomycetaceae bacterium]